MLSTLADLKNLYLSGNKVVIAVLGNSIGCGYRGDNYVKINTIAEATGWRPGPPGVDWGGVCSNEMQNDASIGGWAQQLQVLLRKRNTASVVWNFSGSGWTNQRHVERETLSNTTYGIASLTGPNKPTHIIIPLQTNECGFSMDLTSFTNYTRELVAQAVALGITPILMKELNQPFGWYWINKQYGVGSSPAISGYMSQIDTIANDTTYWSNYPALAATNFKIPVIDAYAPSINTGQVSAYVYNSGIPFSANLLGANWNPTGTSADTAPAHWRWDLSNLWIPVGPVGGPSFDAVHPNQAGHNLLLSSITNSLFKSTSKGIFLAYYEFAVGNLNSPYSYPPDISVDTSNALISEINSSGLVHPWNGAQVQNNLTTLVNLRATYPNVPINIVVNGGADGAYWHDAGSVYDANFHSAMQTLRASGIKIYGYIDPTVYTVNIASSKEKIDRWYSMYGDVLDGIFLDDYAVSDYLPTWPYLSVAYYDELNQYIRNKRNPTMATTIPLVCGNINGWWNGNRTNQNSAYFSSVNAPDYWLVAESIINDSYMNPAGVPTNKKWALLYDTPSASMSDAQFNALMTNVDWVMISERNYATYQYLPNWLTRQVQLLSALNGGSASTNAAAVVSGRSMTSYLGSVVGSGIKNVTAAVSGAPIITNMGTVLAKTASVAHPNGIPIGISLGNVTIYSNSNALVPLIGTALVSALGSIRAVSSEVHPEVWAFTDSSGRRSTFRFDNGHIATIYKMVEKNVAHAIGTNSSISLGSLVATATRNVIASLTGQASSTLVGTLSAMATRNITAQIFGIPAVMSVGAVTASTALPINSNFEGTTIGSYGWDSSPIGAWWSGYSGISARGGCAFCETNGAILSRTFQFNAPTTMSFDRFVSSGYLGYRINGGPWTNLTTSSWLTMSGVPIPSGTVLVEFISNSTSQVRIDNINFA